MIDRCEDNRFRPGVWRVWHSPRVAPCLVCVVSRRDDGMIRVVRVVRVGAPVYCVPAAHLQPVTRADLPGTCGAPVGVSS